jgi:sec-independent protein translocase protein TatA
MIQANLLGVLGTQEIIIILVIVLLLFGGRKIPELMRGLGRGVREFNDAKNNVRKEIEDNVNNVNSGVNETKTPSLFTQQLKIYFSSSIKALAFV